MNSKNSNKLLVLRLIAWISIILLPQLLIFTLLNNYYFIDEKDFKITNLESSKDEKHRADIKIPSDAKNIQFSYRNTYISFFDSNDKLKIIDTKSSVTKDILPSNNSKIQYYKWLPDADLMIIVEELSQKTGKTIRYYSYEINKSIKKEFGDYNNKSNIIKSTAKNNHNIEVSTLTGTMYTKISNNNFVYRIDRNETLTKKQLSSSKLGNFKVTSHDDLLVYEDELTNEIRFMSNKKALNILGYSKFKLIGTDENNNIYVGKLQNNSITKIYFGKSYDQTNTWESINLENNLQLDQIIFNYSGTIYIKQSSNSIQNLKTSKTYKYEGNFLSVNNGQLLSIKNSFLIFNDME